MSKLSRSPTRPHPKQKEVEHLRSDLAQAKAEVDALTSMAWSVAGLGLAALRTHGVTEERLIGLVRLGAQEQEAGQ